MNEKGKEQLQNMLDIIDKLCEREEYRWFKNELQKRFGGKENAAETSSGSMGTHSINEDETNKIDAIYEYCIHDLLKKQADDFFVGLTFPAQTMDSIKAAYVSMEKSKLYGDFENFSFYLHKQIDIIFGFLVSQTEFGDIVKKMWQQGSNINTKKWDSEKNKEIFKNKEEYTLSDRKKDSTKIALFIFSKNIDKTDKEKRPLYQTQVEKNLISISSNMKQKLLLYYFVYKTMLHYNNTEEFNKDFDNLRDIVDCRNAYTHEGGQLTEQQRYTFSKVMSNPVKYYFTFIGTYCKLIQGLCSYESTIQELRDFLNNLKEEKNEDLCDATIKSILPGACFIAIDNDSHQIEGKLFNICKNLKEGDTIKARIVDGKIEDIIIDKEEPT